MSALGPIVPDLAVRRREAETMDDPELDLARHLRALRALGRVNRISLTSVRVWREAVAAARALGRPVRILDVACGGGDVVADVARRSGASDRVQELGGCDVSEVALAEARRNLQAAAWDGSSAFHRLDVSTGELPAGYDLVVCSLFLHHLDRADASDLLARMARATHHALLVQDLRRTRLGYLFAWVGLRVLTRSDVARVDGLRSVRAAFTLAEARALCAEAGLEGARVERAWPQRFTIRWRR